MPDKSYPYLNSILKELGSENFGLAVLPLSGIILWKWT